MPKMQVYLPQELHDRVKARADQLNVSSVLQNALEATLAEIERQEALGELLREYEASHGPITEADIEAREALDRRAARRPGRSKPGRSKRKSSAA